MFRTGSAPLTLHRLLGFCRAEARAIGILEMWFLTEPGEIESAFMIDAIMAGPSRTGRGSRYFSRRLDDNRIYSLDQGFIDRLWPLLTAPATTFRPTATRQIIRDIRSAEAAFSLIAWLWRDSLRDSLEAIGRDEPLVVLIDVEKGRIGLHRHRPTPSRRRPKSDFDPAPIASCRFRETDLAADSVPDPRHCQRPPVAMVPSQTAEPGHDLVWLH